MFLGLMVLMNLFLALESHPVQASPAVAPFKWAVANAAFQVEGSPQDSDWLRWTLEPGRISDGTLANRVIDFWNQYEVEFDAAKELGVNAFRLSIAWERVQPNEDKWHEESLARYEKMAMALRARGIEPLITLHHFVLPQWLVEKGGLQAKEFPRYFAEFSKKVVARLANGPAQVKTWITFNEPVVLVRGGYLDGDWPPGKKQDSKGAVEGLAQIARAHFAAVQALRALPSGVDLKIGIAQHWRWFEPREKGFLNHLATRLANWFFNGQMVNSLTEGRIFFAIPGGGWVREAATPGIRYLDFMGINYYGRTLVEFSWKPPFVVASEGPGPKNDLGWEIHGPGLKNVIHQVSQYGLPILITENGTADSSDRLRPDFLRQHLQAMKEAMDEGAPVMGYCHWSLTDNFEWAKGLTPKFGLVSFDRYTLKRTRRSSFFEYQRLIREFSVRHVPPFEARFLVDFK